MSGLDIAGARLRIQRVRAGMFVPVDVLADDLEAALVALADGLPQPQPEWRDTPAGWVQVAADLDRIAGLFDMHHDRPSAAVSVRDARRAALEAAGARLADGADQ